jgi:hypothetical protein
MQKHIFSIIVIVVSFFGSLVWAEDKIMLCSGDENYGSHSSLGIEGYKDATVFVRMRTHLLREPSIHYRIGLGDWKKWCSGGVVEVEGNTAICEMKKGISVNNYESNSFAWSMLGRMYPNEPLLAPNKDQKYPLPPGFTPAQHHFPWFKKQIENLVISFTSLTINHSSRRVFTDRVGNSFQDSFSSNQECQIP